MEENKNTIGVAIITKNRIEQLKRLLPQLKSFDQVVVVDTGSHDGTEKYVRDLGKPFQFRKFPWRAKPRKSDGPNDWGFAAARNESFKYLTTTHGLWLDTDDLIGQVKDGKDFIASADQAYRAFKKVVDEAPQIDVWFMNYVYSRDINNQPNVFHARERVVRLSHGWTWVYPIHEVLSAASTPKHSMIEDVQVIHFPTNEAGDSAERNITMLNLWKDQLEAVGDHHELSRCRLLIGDTLWAQGKYKECADWLITEFIRKHPEALDIEKWQAWCFVAKSQIELNNFEAAKAAALATIDLEPGLADGYILLAQIKLMMEEDPQDVLMLLDHAGRAEEPPPQVIKNPLDYSFTPRCLVSSCKFQLGQYDAALDWALKAQAVCPEDNRAEVLRMQAAEKIRERDAVGSALALYQLYLDYDENEKAHKLFEVLPYVAQHNDDVIKAAELAEKRIRHVFDRDEYVKLYAENSHWKPVDDEWILNETPAGQDRYEYVMSRLKAALPNGGRILDVGCSDGFHSLLYAKHGFEVVGVDLDKRCVDIGNERAEKWGRSAKFVHGFFEEMEPEKQADPFDKDRNWLHNFDAVVCSEVIEHVQNPEFLIGALGDCAKDFAPIIITTPNGAFDRGDIPNGGGMFEEDKEMAGHVRVYTQETFEALMKKDPEYHVIESHFVPFKNAYRNEQGWQCGEIRRMPRPNGPVIRVFCGDAVKFNPNDLNEGGVGGSETAVIHMARTWAMAGCQVVIYSGVNGVYDGVFYRTADHFDINHRSDIFVSWRLPTAFQYGRPNAATTIFWAHDLYYPIQIPGEKPNQFPKEWTDRIDKVVVLSKFHKEFMESVHPCFAGKFWISRNGIDPTRYVGHTVERVTHRYVYSSSYDRGLEELLAVWPNIKSEIPDAELHVCYGMAVAEDIYKHTGETEKLNKLYRLVAQMETMPGVVHHEKLGQQELANLQLSSEAWLYPAQPRHDNQMGGFLETYCITALEVQAAGCVPITRLNGALKEVVQNSIEWDSKLDIVPTLKDLKFSEDKLKENQRWALAQTWEGLAIEWLQILAPKPELVEV